MCSKMLPLHHHCHLEAIQTIKSQCTALFKLIDSTTIGGKMLSHAPSSRKSTLANQVRRGIHELQGMETVLQGDCNRKGVCCWSITNTGALSLELELAPRQALFGDLVRVFHPLLSADIYIPIEKFPPTETTPPSFQCQDEGLVTAPFPQEQRAALSVSVRVVGVPVCHKNRAPAAGPSRDFEHRGQLGAATHKPLSIPETVGLFRDCFGLFLWLGALPCSAMCSRVVVRSRSVQCYKRQFWFRPRSQLSSLFLW